jgi:hypothetical protein
MKTLKCIFLSTIVFMCSSQFSAAQDGNARISGVIFNPDNHPAMYSTVILLNEDSVLVKGAFSQQDGSFVIEKIAPGNILSLSVISNLSTGSLTP